MEELGFNVMHIYGMTELHGISTTCEPRPEWEGFEPEERATRMAQQGVRQFLLREKAKGV